MVTTATSASNFASHVSIDSSSSSMSRSCHGDSSHGDDDDDDLSHDATPSPTGDDTCSDSDKATDKKPVWNMPSNPSSASESWPSLSLSASNKSPSSSDSDGSSMQPPPPQRKPFRRINNISSSPAPPFNTTRDQREKDPSKYMSHRITADNINNYRLRLPTTFTDFTDADFNTVSGKSPRVKIKLVGRDGVGHEITMNVLKGKKRFVLQKNWIKFLQAEKIGLGDTVIFCSGGTNTNVIVLLDVKKNVESESVPPPASPPTQVVSREEDKNQQACEIVQEIQACLDKLIPKTKSLEETCSSQKDHIIMLEQSCSSQKDHIIMLEQSCSSQKDHIIMLEQSCSSQKNIIKGLEMKLEENQKVVGELKSLLCKGELDRKSLIDTIMDQLESMTGERPS